MIELMVAITVLGILVTLAPTPFRRWVEASRVRSGLNMIVAEIYRARAAAVAGGTGATLVVESNGEGCVERVLVRRNDGAVVGRTLPDLSGVCMRHSGGPVLTFNNRGMLRPPTRSFYGRYGDMADSLLISIAGRVRRSYRRKGDGRLCRGRQRVPYSDQV